MSATDDASASSHSVSPGHPARLALAVCGLLLGGFAFATVGPRLLPGNVARFQAEASWTGEAPLASDWPRPPRPGESAVVDGEDGARVIRVSSHHAADAALLATSMAWERTQGAGADRARREALQQAALGEQFIGPLYGLAPAAECAALLRAHARAARALAGPAPAGEEAPPDAAERVTGVAIEEAAGSADPAMLSDALAASLIVERERLLRDAAADPPAGRDLRARWQARLHRFARDLDGLAGPIEAAQTPLQSELIARVTPSLVGAAEPRFAVPSEALLAASPPPPAPRVRPAAALTAGLAALGGGVGAALGWLLGLAFRRGRKRGPDARRPALAGPPRAAVDTAPPPLPAARTLAEPGAWLQIVSGVRARDVARGVIEIVAHGAAAGGRVLVVDAGRSLALHRAFGAESRPGLVDCLMRPLPALGVVQQGGAPRVLLLAFGDPRRRPVWIHLDRLLEEVRPHCDQVVLALAPDAPREIGSVLAGRRMDGWWCGPAATRNRGAAHLQDHLGIAFNPLLLEAGDPPSLERLRARIAALTPVAPVPDAAVTPAIPEPGSEAAASPAAAAEVLDSDLQVRERLRFLAWMRRVQAEGRRDEVLSSRD